ncbi:Mrp/NBP35 family ATP-binding protein [Bifidobacterium thermophilum]|uniref:Mrp/NBP35 family ATP-binding protein n=1 Tax=Bifidobacterium thermophilum TaxID=33905 RepID=UPI001F0E74C3|nr:Mrp/NBP35 family ATP-binding protein [Bifidobacterium thermophilum]
MAHTPTSQQAATTTGAGSTQPNAGDTVRNADITTVPAANGQPNAIEIAIYHRLSKVIDPELGRSITDLGMIATIEATPHSTLPLTFDVTVHVELTVAGCPLSKTITNQINGAVASYPDATLIPHIEVTAMSQDKLANLVAQLKAERRQNPFTKPGVHTRIFAIASGKGGVGKSSVTANLAATFAALGYDTAAIDADIYGFSLPRLFGVHTQPTNLNGMLMPVVSWGVKLMSIGMFAGSERAILWRGPRLQRSLEQFLSDVWWGSPDVLLLDMAPGTGDMAISVAQTLPNAELVVVTTPQPSASEIAVRSGLVALQVPMTVRGVVENMSYFEHNGERLEIFGHGGGQRVSEQLTHALGYDVPLLAELPLEPQIREIDDSGRPAVLTPSGVLADTPLAAQFTKLAQSLMDNTK